MSKNANRKRCRDCVDYKIIMPVKKPGCAKAGTVWFHGSNAGHFACPDFKQRGD